MEKKQNRFLNITLVLLVAALVVSSVAVVSSGTAAKFLAAAVGGDKAQVAIFAADANAVSTGALEINCNTGKNEASYQFAVSNQKNGKTSEVAMGYTIEVTLPKALSAGLAMAIDGVSGTVDSSGKTYIFTYEDWTFDAGVAETQTHTLTFVADPAVQDFNVEMDKIKVSVTIEQIN